MRFPLAALAAVSLLAAGVAGCGAGSGADDGELRLLVTRDFGARELAARLVQDAPSDATPAGLAESLGLPIGARGDGWFLYVNGVRRPLGSDDELHGGDRVWWDRHAPDVVASAVVGSYPEPFAHGAEGRRYPLVLECAEDAERACDVVSERLSASGAIPARQTLGTGVGGRTVRVLVGRWSVLRADQALAQIDRDPAGSGVFARFDAGGRSLTLLDADGDAVDALGPGAGLVAATRFEEQAPTWAVTGTDAAGVEAAARALGERALERRFAVALDGARAIALPVRR